MVSRATGWVRDKVLFWALGAGDINDAFRAANRIPNAFRALLAEGALHAAFVPALSRLAGREERRREASELVRGLLAVLLLILAVVVGGGMLLAPWLVKLFAQGYGATPGKLELTVVMTRLMFPYLAFISVAALLQGVLNSHERFLLPAATPILYNLSLAGVAWLVVSRAYDPAPWLCAGVLVGGLLQAAVQWPAVRRLGFRLRPIIAGFRDPAVRRVLLLMLPGIPVLGINQLNQLVSTRFASFIGEGAVTVTYGAYRITELMFGGIVIQLTTVLLPVLSRQLRSDPQQAPKTLVDTMSLVSFVTLPTATFLWLLPAPIVGLAFGGGRFGPEAVVLTAATLSAYAFSLVGLGQAKVMASAFFAQRDTRTPMFCSFLSLALFTCGCAVLAPRSGAPGIGLANTIAVVSYGLALSCMYGLRFGFSGVGTGRFVLPQCRQVVGCFALGLVAHWVAPWLADVQTTSLVGLIRVLMVVLGAGGVYVGVVAALGGREIAAMWAGLTRRAEP